MEERKVSDSSPPANKLAALNMQTVIIALRCWGKIAIPLSVISGIAIGVLIYVLHKPIYTAEALLWIDEKPDFILNKDLQSDSRKYIQNQIEIIRSPRLLGPLVSNPAIRATPELEHEQDPTLTLSKKLVIRPKNQSDMYILSFTSESPEKAALIVKEVVDAYLAFNRKLEAEQDQRIISLLEDQRTARYEEMNQLRENVRSLSIQLTGNDPYRSNAQKKDADQTQALLDDLQEEVVRGQVEQEVLSAKIKRAEEKLAGNQVDVSPREIDQQIESHPRFLAIRTKLEALKRKADDYRKTTKEGVNNPRLKDLESQIAVERKAEDALRQELQEEITSSLREAARAEYEKNIEQWKADYAAADTRLKVLNDNLKNGMNSAKQYTGDSLELDYRKAKLDQVSKIHDEIQKRILAITTEQRAPDRVRLFKEPTKPSRADEEKLFIKIGLASGVAFLLPLVLAVAWEVFFQRVTSRTQIESSNSMIVLGEVTTIPTKTLKMGKTAEQHILLFEESVDSLRTCLSLVETFRGLRALAVTSAISGEGKTSLSSQLAVSIARATNEPTLLIDGDMRSPDIHNVFEISGKPGLAEYLDRRASLEDVINKDYSDNLHIIPAGRLANSPHRLLGRGEFAALIDQLRTRYRHIVIDTPPILPASESLILARAADAAIMCMRRDHSRIDQAQDAYGRMLSAGVNVGGVVLNGIPLQQYAYKYGDYEYNRATPTDATTAG